MASPVFSPPTLFTPADLRGRPALIDDITDLINDAFTRSELPDPEKWEGAHNKRFPSRESYLEMLGEEGVIATIFDDTRVVAVAAAIPWKGGWKKEGAGVEEGWEIKSVAVHNDAKYLHRGLAVQLYTSLEQFLIKQERGRLLAKSDRGIACQKLTGYVGLWILAAECINGVYWRKRGYREIRRDTYGPGTWGCLTSFEMVVLRKDIAFDVNAVPLREREGLPLASSDASPAI